MEISARQHRIMSTLGVRSLSTKEIREHCQFRTLFSTLEALRSLKMQGLVRSVSGGGKDSHGTTTMWSLTERGLALVRQASDPPVRALGRHQLTWLRWLEELSPLARSITNYTDRDRVAMAQALALAAPGGPVGFTHAEDCDCALHRTESAFKDAVRAILDSDLSLTDGVAALRRLADPDQH
jgi:hypothetical protein